MDNKDLLKELESLKERVSELESQKKDNLNMFGRSYSQVGSSNSDFLIKTKGQVKIQWGSKFIDLIKDGKIAVDSNFIFSVSDVSKIGVRDGLYVVGQSIYLKVGGSVINLVGEAGSTYVSFMEGQETTSDDKYHAMINIGFIYKSLEEINENSLKNGVIYIESEQKLYIVTEGTLSEFKITIPNPFTQQFVIQKTDGSKGALVIKGSGVENSIAFDTFQIYTEYEDCIINANNQIIVKSGESDKITIGDTVKVGVDLIANMIKSDEASSNTGFRLYYINGEAVLEVDRLVLRGTSSEEDEEGAIILYPEYWLLNNKVVKDAVPHDDTPEDGEEISQLESTNILDITFFQECSYEVGDILCAYKQEDIEEDTGEVDEEGIPITNTISSYSKVELEVIEISDDKKTIQVQCEEALDEDTISNFIGRFIFLIKSPNNLLPLRLNKNNLDIVEYGDLSENKREEAIKTRIGDLSGIQDGDTALEGSGIYSDHLVVGGTKEEHFPKYTNTLNSILLGSNIKESNEYDCVLISVGLLKEILKENQEAIDELKQKVTDLETEVEDIKQQLDSKPTT